MDSSTATPGRRFRNATGWQAGALSGIVFVAVLLGCLGSSAPSLNAQSGLSPNAAVFATGLFNPRGLNFGPDGALYVAEGGTAGTNMTVGTCQQVPQVGPYSGGPTGSRISRIASDGSRTTVADGLPASATTPQTGSFTSGVAAVAFIGNTLYGIEAGAGCSHGVPDVPNGVFRVNADETWTLIADLGSFQRANPTQVVQPADFEPDGTWYSMVAKDGMLYAVEPNHGELDAITVDGQVSRVADISASLGHAVPTSLAVGPDGNFYVGNLGNFPAEAGTQIVARITPAGAVDVVAAGFTAVTGVAFDAQGRLYVLENGAPGTDPMGPPIQPGTGRVLRVRDDGGFDVVASGLTLPTAMTFGPDGFLYVSDVGYGPQSNAGGGQIVRIDACGGPC